MPGSTLDYFLQSTPPVAEPEMPDELVTALE